VNDLEREERKRRKVPSQEDALVLHTNCVLKLSRSKAETEVVVELVL